MKLLILTAAFFAFALIGTVAAFAERDGGAFFCLFICVATGIGAGIVYACEDNDGGGF